MASQEQEKTWDSFIAALADKATTHGLTVVVVDLNACHSCGLMLDSDLSAARNLIVAQDIASPESDA